MTPENANVYLVEDDPDWAHYATEELEKGGHKVVLQASNLTDALAGIEQAKELGVNVAVVDGNLKKMDFSGRDGQTVSDALKKAIPDIKIVAFSGNLHVAYGDVHAPKGETSKLPGIVDSL